MCASQTHFDAQHSVVGLLCCCFFLALESRCISWRNSCPHYKVLSAPWHCLIADTAERRQLVTQPKLICTSNRPAHEMCGSTLTINACLDWWGSQLNLQGPNYRPQFPKTILSECCKQSCCFISLFFFFFHKSILRSYCCLKILAWWQNLVGILWLKIGSAVLLMTFFLFLKRWWICKSSYKTPHVYQACVLWKGKCFLLFLNMSPRISFGS